MSPEPPPGPPEPPEPPEPPSGLPYPPPYPPPGPLPGPPAPGPSPARLRRRRAVLSAVVIAFAAAGVAITAATDRLDAAVLFVGLPALLAFGIVLRPPARTLHGSVAAGTTLALLLAAMLLQEGAICVLLSAPLVFGVAHAVAAAVRAGRSRHQALVLLPLLLITSLEGLAPEWRVHPIHTVGASRTVAAAGDAVAAHLAEGPALDRARRPWLLRTGIPVPTSASGTGLDVGDRWTFDYRGRPIVTEVVAREVTDGGRAGTVAFALVHDGSKTARWLTWRHATLRWAPAAGGVTSVAVEIEFERGLDPSWWFGPIEDALVRAAADHLLDGLLVTVHDGLATATGGGAR